MTPSSNAAEKVTILKVEPGSYVDQIGKFRLKLLDHNLDSFQGDPFASEGHC